jgi:glycosyltransferase involved in cell wall biosynthesis
MKILLITDIISPYRVPVFNALAKEEGISLSVLALCKNMKGRHWLFPEAKIKFDYHILKNIQLAFLIRPALVINFNIIKALKMFNPDLIICGGYYQPAYIQALLYACKYKKRILLWTESHQQSISMANPFINTYRRWFLDRCSGFIVPGKKAKDFLISLGRKEKDIYIAPNAVDNDFFIERTKDIRKIKEDIKRKKRLPKNLILYVGRIIKEKGVRDLLEAYKDVANKDTGLIFVGSVRDEKRLKRKAAEENIEHVFFEGFKQIEDLPLYYGISDIFVFPSYNDVWGLVINEACAAGLPIISSASTGGACELVSAENGAVYEKKDIEGLRNCLKRILLNDGVKETMGEKSRERILQYSPDICANKISEAAKKVLSL